MSNIVHLLPSGRTVDDMLQDLISHHKTIDVHHNHELFYNIIHIDDDVIRMLLSGEDVDFLKSIQQVSDTSLSPPDRAYVHQLLVNAMAGPFQRVHVTGDGTSLERMDTPAVLIPGTSASIGLVPYAVTVMGEFARLLKYGGVDPDYAGPNTWMIEVLAILLRGLFLSLVNEERSTQKHTFTLKWQDRNGNFWEMLIGEFSGWPFGFDPEKCFTDRCELFRSMKDILDARIAQALHMSQGRTDQSMLMYGIQSRGTSIDLFALNMPFPHIYVVSLICSLEIPYLMERNYEQQILILVDRLWNILRNGVAEEIIKITTIELDRPFPNPEEFATQLQVYPINGQIVASPGEEFGNVTIPKGHRYVAVPEQAVDLEPLWEFSDLQ
ncbi:4645_t:CDS:2 [Paraglomus brasilianum]|uniref:4645_t:CDS:1 n=1 Tax=Paraglomus brasilianum TaxID=144538 RepID=A0A9N9B5H9_9GLOM|nr:4645_t:CDS:2 [Paraglomus brasilianum]